MRMRRILLIHSTRSIRALIMKFVFAELSDIDFIETDCGKDALTKLSAHPFNVVICTAGLVDMSSAELMAASSKTPHNATTPFVVVTEQDDDGDHSLSGAPDGLNGGSVINTRLQPDALIQAINQMCNPRQWRESSRYYIPNAKVVIDVWGTETKAALINISMGGILVELNSQKPDLLMKNDIHVTLKFPGTSDYYVLPNIACKLSRLNISSWNEDGIPADMRVTFIFQALSEETRGKLEAIMQLAKEDQLVADD